MKKFKNVKVLLFGFIIMMAFCFMNTSVYAKEMTSDEIQGPAYVIGTHVFNRETNESTGYDGRLTTNLIMLASQTIDSSDLDSMIIYYKTATGMWINGLTGTPIEAPETFEINYTNLQLEEVNSTVSAPKAPIIDLANAPLDIDEETDMMYYQLDIYNDDIDDKSNKVDGVELCIVDYNSHITWQDLKYSENKFNTIVTVNENYTGDVLSIGKRYHSGFITFECPPDDFYTIAATAYVLDGNGKKTYSEAVYVSISPDTALPAVEIVNNYSNPDYVTFDGSTYTYKLGIKQPDGYVFKIRPERFGYIVYEQLENSRRQVGIFGIDEVFTIEVPKDSIKTYYAQLGYYDVNGDFQHYITVNSEENRKYFTIDARKTITAPVLELDQLEENYDPNRRYGDQVEVDYRMYRNADEDSLDYAVKGIEVYQVNYDGTNMSNFQYIAPLFGITDSFFVQVKPTNGMATYVGRAYAINAVGEKVYSEYSNVVTVIRTPEIEVSDINEGKVNVSIKNIEEYGTAYDLKYKVFNVSGAELTGLVELDEVSSIDIDSTTQLYIRIYKASDDSGNTHSAKSNKVDVVVE